MAPSTMERVGAYGTHAKEEWWNHEALVIDYVNTFRRVGVKAVSYTHLTLPTN